MSKRFQLDPNETANENLWRAAKVATVTLLRKFHIRSFIDDKYIDLFDELAMQTVVSFMHLKIQQRGYDRRFSFFENVYSCCWGCGVANNYFKTEERNKSLVSLSCESTDGVTLESTIADTEKHYLDMDASYTKVKDPKPLSNNALLYRAEDDLKLLWELDDLESESDIDAVEIGEHRNGILRRLHAITDSKEFQKKKRASEYNTAWQRKKRRKSILQNLQHQRQEEPSPHQDQMDQ